MLFLCFDAVLLSLFLLLSSLYHFHMFCVVGEAFKFQLFLLCVVGGRYGEARDLHQHSHSATSLYTYLKLNIAKFMYLDSCTYRVKLLSGNVGAGRVPYHSYHQLHDSRLDATHLCSIYAQG